MEFATPLRYHEQRLSQTHRNLTFRVAQFVHDEHETVAQQHSGEASYKPVKDAFHATPIAQADGEGITSRTGLGPCPSVWETVA